MARSPLPLGTWGRIRTNPIGKGKGRRHRARAKYRDFDGVTREVEAVGRTKTEAENNLRNTLKGRSSSGASGDLTAMHRFSAAATLWIATVEEAVNEGRRSPTTLDLYRRQLRVHVLPALGEVRLGEATPPRLDKVIASIKKASGISTAKTCRTVISGVMAIAVRYGAVHTNPVRDISRIEKGPTEPARALSEAERIAWLDQLRSDPRAVRKDLPDLTEFMLGTGVRIGEALAILWEQVDFEAAELAITHTVVRVESEGLLRKPTKSRAGARVLGLPAWLLARLRVRFAAGGRLDEPVFADALGGFRDPANGRRDLRDARSPVGDEVRQSLGERLKAVRRLCGLTQADAAQALGWPKTRVSLIETARVRLSGDDARALLTLYGTPGAEREKVLELAAHAEHGATDAFSWITSHSFRKTVATILDDAGQSGRQMADQLGHARPSMTQDNYIGRKLRNPGAVVALEAAFGYLDDAKSGGKAGEMRILDDGPDL